MQSISSQNLALRTTPTPAKLKTSPAAEPTLNEPIDCVTLGETYNRQNPRQVYDALQGLKGIAPLRQEPSASGDARKMKALMDMQRQMLNAHVCGDLGRG